MGAISPSVDIVKIDDVRVTIDTEEFLDEVTNVAEKRQQLFDQHIFALVAEQKAINWQCGSTIVETALARTFDVDLEQVYRDADVNSQRSENFLATEFTASIWDIDGHDPVVTIESISNIGSLKSTPQLRISTRYDIEADLHDGYNRLHLWCQRCTHVVELAYESVRWSKYTRRTPTCDEACLTMCNGDDHELQDGLFCPVCDHPVGITHSIDDATPLVTNPAPRP